MLKTLLLDRFVHHHRGLFEEDLEGSSPFQTNFALGARHSAVTAMPVLGRGETIPESDTGIHLENKEASF